MKTDEMRKKREVTLTDGKKTTSSSVGRLIDYAAG